MGVQLGNQLDDQLGFQLGNQRGNWLGTQLGNQLDNQLGTQLGLQLRRDWGSGDEPTSQLEVAKQQCNALGCPRGPIRDLGCPRDRHRGRSKRPPASAFGSRRGRQRLDRGPGSERFRPQRCSLPGGSREGHRRRVSDRLCSSQGPELGPGPRDSPQRSQRRSRGSTPRSIWALGSSRR